MWQCPNCGSSQDEDPDDGCPDCGWTPGPGNKTVRYRAPPEDDQDTIPPELEAMSDDLDIQVTELEKLKAREAALNEAISDQLIRGEPVADLERELEELLFRIREMEREKSFLDLKLQNSSADEREKE